MDFHVQCCFIASWKIHLKSYSMVFNGKCSTKPSNIALLFEMKQMLIRLSKFSSKFPRLKGFGFITRVKIHSHTWVLTSWVREVASEQYRM